MVLQITSLKIAQRIKDMTKKKGMIGTQSDLDFSSDLESDSDDLCLMVREDSRKDLVTSIEVTIENLINE